MLKGLCKSSFCKALWVYHANTGACNGCDIEVIASLTPLYDLERFGIISVGNPKHADVLLITGSVNVQNEPVVKMLYEQMPEPKIAVAVGTCATSGGVFQGCYNVVGHIDEVIPVNAYIPGCPPRPEAIIDGVVKLLQSLQAKQVPTPAPRPDVIESAPVEESAT